MCPIPVNAGHVLQHQNQVFFPSPKEELEQTLLTLKFTDCWHLMGRSISKVWKGPGANLLNLLNFDENIGHKNGSM